MRNCLVALVIVSLVTAAGVANAGDITATLDCDARELTVNNNGSTTVTSLIEVGLRTDCEPGQGGIGWGFRETVHSLAVGETVINIEPTTNEDDLDLDIPNSCNQGGDDFYVFAALTDTSDGTLLDDSAYCFKKGDPPSSQSHSLGAVLQDVKGDVRLVSEIDSANMDNPPSTCISIKETIAGLTRIVSVNEYEGVLSAKYICSKSNSVADECEDSVEEIGLHRVFTNFDTNSCEVILNSVLPGSENFPGCCDGADCGPAGCAVVAMQCARAVVTHTDLDGGGFLPVIPPVWLPINQDEDREVSSVFFDCFDFTYNDEDNRTAATKASCTFGDGDMEGVPNKVITQVSCDNCPFVPNVDQDANACVTGANDTMTLVGLDTGQGAPQGDNWLAVPYVNPYTTADDVCTRLDLETSASITNAEESSTYGCDGTGTDFTLVSGDAVLVHVEDGGDDDGKVIQMVGIHDPDVAITLESGSDNWISLPENATALSAFRVCNNVGSEAVSVSKVDPVDGTETTFTCGSPATDPDNFLTKPVTIGINITVSSNVNWTPTVVTD